MSSYTRLTVLALAAAAVAVPQHGHAHDKLHRRDGPVVVGEENVMAAAVTTTTCTDDVVVTATAKTTVVVTVSPSAIEAAAFTPASSSTSSATTITLTTTKYVFATTTIDEPASSASSVAAAGQPSWSWGDHGSWTAGPWASHWTSASSATTFSSVVSSAVTVDPAAVSAPAPSSTSTSSPAPSTSTTTSSTPVAAAAVPSTSSTSAFSLALPTILPSLLPSLTFASSSTTASSPASYATGSTSGGKRGLAYNSALLTELFSGSSQVSWAYNWGSSSDGLSMSGVQYIPTLWGPTSGFTDSWFANAKSAIAAGSKTLFSFNEPDESSQCNIAPDVAAAGYRTYMDPLAGQGAQLCAPSVTNGGGTMGLTYLSNFLSECSDCHIDCINIHWYSDYNSGAVAYFKEHVTNATQIANGRPVYISEFGLNAPATDSEIESFLQEVMPWMDSNSAVAGYAYFMVSDGRLLSGSGLSSLGSLFKSFT